MTSNHLLIYHLAELMLKHEQNILPVDLLFDDEQIGDFVKSIQIDSPYQQMLLEGVLTESIKDEKLYVSFTVEGYFHYVLGEWLFKNSMGNRFAFLSDVLNSNRLNGIEEGVTQCLIKCSSICEYEPILNFIDSLKTEICIVPLTTAFSGGDIKRILEKIIETESDADYAIIGELVSILKANGKLTIVDQVYVFFIDFFNIIDLDDQYFHRQKLKLKLLSSLEEKTFIDLIESIINKNTNCFGSFNEEQRFLLVFEVNTSIVERGLLKLAHRFANKFQLYQAEIKLITANYYNLIYPLLELGLFEEAESIFLRCEPLNKSDSTFINWSGFIYQSWYELKSGDGIHIEKGLKLYEMSSQIINEVYGRYSLQKYQNLENIGYTYSLLKDNNKAILVLNQAIEIVTKTYGTSIVYPLGNLYEMLAVAINEVGRHQEAIDYTLLSDQCKLLQISFDSPEMAWNHYDRAKIYQKIGDIDKAIKSMSIAYNIRTLSLGEDNGLTMQTKDELNLLLNDL